MASKNTTGVIRPVRRKSGATRYQVYGRRNNKSHYVGTFADERAAAEALEDFNVTERKIERGELPANTDLRRMFGEAVDAWLTTLRKQGARSHRQYAAAVRRYIKPTFGHRPIVAIDSEAVAEWRNDLALRYKPSTVNTAKIALSAAFSFFVKRKWIGTNPCRGVADVERKPRTYAWIRTRGEIERLLAACNPTMRDMVALALGTGVRIDELLHLQWDDVDLDRRLIHVQRGRQGPPKSGEGRRVPILDSVLPVVRRLYLSRGSDRLIFPGQRGRVRSKQATGKTFNRAVARAGIQKLRFHDLRHTMASHWVSDGGNIFTLSKILGHSSVVITEKWYAHLSPKAFAADYGRVAFSVPTDDGADVIPLVARA